MVHSIQDLIKQLNDSHAGAKLAAARELALYYLNKKDEDEIKKLISHQDAYVRFGGVWGLEEAAKTGIDITLALPYLTKALRDKDAIVKRNAAAALVYHYLNKEDKTKIEILVSHKDVNVRLGAVEALGMIAKKGPNISSILSVLTMALRDKNSKVKLNAIVGLKYAAQNGQDITSALPNLINALTDEDTIIKRSAAEALAHHYLNKKDKTKIRMLISHKNVNVRLGAIWTLGRAAQNGQNIVLALPDLINIFRDKDINVRGYAFRILKIATETGTDITPVIPALINYLEDENESLFKLDAAKILQIYKQQRAIKHSELVKKIAKGKAERARKTQRKILPKKRAPKPQK